eukprot:4814491-Pleurochrysis_carterae.AAC.1
MSPCYSPHASATRWLAGSAAVAKRQPEHGQKGRGRVAQVLGAAHRALGRLKLARQSRRT